MTAMAASRHLDAAWGGWHTPWCTDSPVCARQDGHARLGEEQVEYDVVDTPMNIVAEPTAAPIVRGHISISVVDDHELVAQLLIDALGNAGYEIWNGFHPSHRSIIEGFQAGRPDIVLLDYALGEQGDAIDLIGPATAVGANVVMLSASDDRLVRARCVEAGAVGFLHKGIAAAELVRRLDAIAAGTGMISQDERSELIEDLRHHRRERNQSRAPFDGLTDRERQVLVAICDGESAAQMAERWVVSIATIRTHIRSVLVKLGVGSQLEAVAMARRAGFPTFEGWDRQL